MIPSNIKEALGRYVEQRVQILDEEWIKEGKMKKIAVIEIYTDSNDAKNMSVQTSFDSALTPMECYGLMEIIRGTILSYIRDNYGEARIQKKKEFTQ